MTKSQYTGILAQPIPQDDEAARREALEALGAHHGVAVSETLTPLEKALIAAHVPAFQPQPPAKKPRRRSGRKRTLSPRDYLIASNRVRELIKRNPRMKLATARRLVWKKGYSGQCDSYETFRQNISHIIKIPPEELLDEKSDDETIVKQLKHELKGTVVVSAFDPPDEMVDGIAIIRHKDPSEDSPDERSNRIRKLLEDKIAPLIIRWEDFLDRSLDKTVKITDADGRLIKTLRIRAGVSADGDPSITISKE